MFLNPPTFLTELLSSTNRKTERLKWQLDEPLRSPYVTNLKLCSFSTYFRDSIVPRHLHRGSGTICSPSCAVTVFRSFEQLFWLNDFCNVKLPPQTQLVTRFLWRDLDGNETSVCREHAALWVCSVQAHHAAPHSAYFNTTTLVSPHAVKSLNTCWKNVDRKDHLTFPSFSGFTGITGYRMCLHKLLKFEIWEIILYLLNFN